MQALRRAAANHRQTLTPNDVAISRARDARGVDGHSSRVDENPRRHVVVHGPAIRIEAHLKAMMANGTLHEFNRAFKRRRMEAAANGQGFMSFATATARLRQALIPLLVNARAIGPVQTLYEQIFDR